MNICLHMPLDSCSVRGNSLRKRIPCHGRNKNIYIFNKRKNLISSDRNFCLVFLYMWILNKIVEIMRDSLKE